MNLDTWLIVLTWMLIVLCGLVLGDLWLSVTILQRLP